MSTLEGESIDPPLPPLPIARSSTPPTIPWNLLAAGVGIGLVLSFFGPSWMQDLLRSTAASTVSGLATLLAALAAAIVLHESGHLVAAVMQDFEVLGGSLGPVRAIRLHGRWSLQFSGKLFSGSVIAIPRRNDPTWRTRMLAVVAGGPAVTFLSGLIAAMVALWLGRPGSWPVRFFSCLAELSFFLFVLGLFPNAPGIRTGNDARLFYSLLHNTREAQQMLLYHLLTQLQIAGVRPREYPRQIISKLAQTTARPEMCLAYANAIATWALDRADAAAADAWDKRAIDLSGFCDLKSQNSALATSACFDIVLRNDLTAAAGKLADVQVEMLSPAWFRHRTKALHWLVTGNIHESLAEIARARYSFPNQLPYFDFETKLLGRIHRIAVTTQPQDLTRQHRMKIASR